MLKANNRVAYFTGCTANYIEPDIGRAVIGILEENGLRPVFPEQKCCAIPRLAYGDINGFKKNARYNVRSLAGTDCDIVTACTSCALTIKKEYPAILNDPDAIAVAGRTYDILEYLIVLKARNDLNTSFGPVNLNILYHAPCHLKVLGKEIIDSRVKFMKSIPEINLDLLNRGCCGMGGTFGLKHNNFKMSMAIGQSLFDEIERSSPDMVATECPGCKMQIEKGTKKQVVHPIILIKQACRS